MSKKELNKKDKKTKEELYHKSSNSKEEEKKNLEKNNDDVEELQKRIKMQLIITLMAQLKILLNIKDTKI